MAKDFSKILIVDDEEEIRFLLETKFSRAGYEVTVAADAKEALKGLLKGDRYDLIVCDLRMPEMSGIELYMQLERTAPGTQFLLITGYPEKDQLTAAMQKGIVHIMLKPVKHSEILEKVKNMLEGKE